MIDSELRERILEKYSAEDLLYALDLSAEELLEAFEHKVGEAIEEGSIELWT